MLKNTVWFKFLIANLIAIVWIGVTDYNTGWLRKLYFSDTTYVNQITLAMFAITFLNLIGWNLWLNHLLNHSDEPRSGSRFGEASIIGTRWIEKAAGWMLFMGLIGTIYGLMLSISNISPSNFGTPEGIKQIAVQMIAGLRVELSTTLIGAMAALWTEVNYMMTKHAAEHLHMREG